MQAAILILYSSRSEETQGKSLERGLTPVSLHASQFPLHSARCLIGYHSVPRVSAQSACSALLFVHLTKQDSQALILNILDISRRQTGLCVFAHTGDRIYMQSILCSKSSKV